MHRIERQREKRNDKKMFVLVVYIFHAFIVCLHSTENPKLSCIKHIFRIRRTSSNGRVVCVCVCVRVGCWNDELFTAAIRRRQHTVVSLTRFSVNNIYGVAAVPRIQNSTVNRKKLRVCVCAHTASNFKAVSILVVLECLNGHDKQDIGGAQ